MEGKSDSSRRYQLQNKREWRRGKGLSSKPFAGCDGEGCGTDEKGRQHYLLLRCGGSELYTGKPLSSSECLSAICASDADKILVGFAFGYDVTMILRDLPEERLRRLTQPPAPFEEGVSRFTWWKEFDLEYLPKQYFRVRKTVQAKDHKTGEYKRVPVKHSCRTIYEVFGFFQKSFLGALESFNTGTKEQRRSIAENKARRSGFTEIGQVERDYCALECQLLAELMTQLRENCHAAGIYPRTWNGAGKLAKALHGLHKTPTTKNVLSWLPPDVHNFANMAYYGGRFEITRVGNITGKVHEYDIRSAYPDAMRSLPCLQHGTWEKKKGAELSAHNGLYVAAVTYRPSKGCSQTSSSGDRPRKGGLAGLPCRSSDGYLFWPMRGQGVYWSEEIKSAQALGYTVTHHEGWCYTAHCDCKTFDWVEPLYEFRRSLGASAAGYPIKLGVNSLYGTLAQRKGSGQYCNMVWAGIITARTRAKINYAIRDAGVGNVVMIATDGVYSVKPIASLAVSEKLGEWEHAELDGLFIVQPGLYWSPSKRKLKSRGLSVKLFEERGRTKEFENAWSRYCDFLRSRVVDVAFPVVPVSFPFFAGLKIALARNKPDIAGRWTTEERKISFDYTNKRQGHILHEGCLITYPKTGDAKLKSVPHKDFLKSGGQETWEALRDMLEEQQDYIDLSAPYED